MEWHIGKRLSYQGKCCTVRYLGPIEGKDDRWLGVEWDDESTGKHDGSLNGHRYFQCLSSSATAASFVRPNRKSDPSVSLLQALLDKYANPGHAEQTIQISGKTVEEVGFEKIQRQIQDFQELRTIVLDKRCISFDGPGYGLTQQIGDLEDLHLKVRELDLSQNLLETWKGILKLCAPLKLLESLDVSGNRFLDDVSDVPAVGTPAIALSIKSLNLEKTLLYWTQIIKIVEDLPNLNHLNASRNNIEQVSTPLRGSHLTVLDLSYNCIESLRKCAPLSDLPRLSHLSLRGNPIAELTCQSGPPFVSLTRLDLADTLLKDLTTLNNIPKIFPLLDWLLTKDSPLANVPSANLFTIARIPNLEVLNHVKVSSEERQNAEIFYLNIISKELEEAFDAEGEAEVLQKHQRWEDLCRIYGPPKLSKPKTGTIDPDTLEARTTIFTFYIARSDCLRAHENYEKKGNARRSSSPSDQSLHTQPASTEEMSGDLVITGHSMGESTEKTNQRAKSSEHVQRSNSEQVTPQPARKEDTNLVPADNEKWKHPTSEAGDVIEKIAYIPRTTSNYALQGKVGRLFALPPPFTTTIRLFLEFDEWVASNKFTSSTSTTEKRDKISRNYSSGYGDSAQDSDDDSGWSLSQDDDEVYNDVNAWLKRRRERGEGKGRWVKRVIELKRSTRGVGDFLSWKGFELGMEARVRVAVV